MVFPIERTKRRMKKDRNLRSRVDRLTAKVKSKGQKQT